ncbi:hypothetical protein DKX38_029079 [Salix brachista]|uniref:Uncharacterized protein n=1 Tax=Salix brachista TaxID=2182728 RepID=A0A5N5IYN3_9ROSI|nr:hypothetical protein DKX38_029079 [Salix brachista]
MRDAMNNLGGDSNKINPSVPVDLVIDHSVQVDVARSENAVQANMELGFQRNKERFAFLKWGSNAFQNMLVVPPGSGIVHQVNLEYLGRVVFNTDGLLYPDSVVGTDSHTTMIDGLGVAGWGVGGIEAEAAMLGQPMSMVLPGVVGFKLSGKLRDGVTATDLVLTVTQMLRKHRVVGKFVEFYGEGMSELSLANRATIANMSPESDETVSSSVLLKECRDIQLRCGSSGHDQVDDSKAIAPVGMDVESDPENAILERLTFKDINGLVEQNVQLKSLVRDLSDQIEDREMVFKEKFEMELKKHTDEAASKVAAVLQRAEEQGHMIESLHTSVAMYKRLYEEEHKLRSSYSHSSDAVTVEDSGRKNRLLLLEDSQGATKKTQEKVVERLRSLEEDLAKSKSDIILLRSERDKLALDAKFARERLDSFMKEFEYQRNEMNENLVASEELSRKLNMEVSVLKLENEILSNAERRACDEVRSLSERVHRLQATLDIIHSAEEAREEARAA